MPSRTGRSSHTSPRRNNASTQGFEVPFNTQQLLGSLDGLPHGLIRHARGGPLMFDMSVHHAGSIHSVVYADSSRPVCIDMNTGTISVHPTDRDSRRARRRQEEGDAELPHSDSDMGLADELYGDVFGGDTDGLLSGQRKEIQMILREEGKDRTSISESHEGAPLDTNKLSATKLSFGALDEGRNRIAPLQEDGPPTVTRILATKSSFDSLVEDYDSISHSDLKDNTT